jgi:hypothetical protein
MFAMGDDKNGREKQARDAGGRQRQRDIDAELERGDEVEPPAEADLDDIASALESVEFPATGVEIVATIGDYGFESDDGSYTIEQLVPESDEEAFDSPAAVRVYLRRPTVAAVMRRVIEASKTLPDPEFPWSQRKAYEATFRALKAIDADDSEGIQAIGDWTIERIREKRKLPRSRDVRRQAAKFCRVNGYQVRTDE